MSRAIPSAAALFLMSMTACTTLDGMAVGRTDRLKGAPFYKTYSPVVLPAQNVLVLPVTIDPVSREEHLRGREQLLQPLQDAFDAYIARKACCVPTLSNLPNEGGPWVYVGSSEGEYAPPQAEVQHMEYEKYPPMVIHLDKPDARWRAAAVDRIANEDAGAIVVIQLGFAQYPKADQGFFGKKVVLGTNHEQPIRFLSAETKPVEVLQIAGMLVDSSGEVIRAGAEGIIARDAPFWLQVLEAGRDIDNAAIQGVLVDERRDDLPGAPLSWQIAIDNLLRQLLRPGK